MKKAKMIGVILITAVLLISVSACSINRTNGLSNRQSDTAELNTPETSPDSKEDQNTTVKEENTEVPGLAISGTVNYKELENGFYELDGYRLSGDQDFSKYKGKFAVAVGDSDDSPGIYMVKAIKVRDIISNEDQDFNERIKKLTDEYSIALSDAQAEGKEKDVTELISNNINMLQMVLSKSGESKESATDIKEGTGKYAGQADSNFIEIEISGTADSKNFRVFQLSPELKEKFSDLGLKTGDSIQFRYQDRKDQNPLLLELQIKN
jgi:hypothetical protein